MPLVRQTRHPSVPSAPPRLTTVMVVDDEPFVRTLCRRVLEDAGYQVYEAGDGVDALGLLAELGRVDAVVTDLLMPNMDGFTLAAYLTRQSPAIPVLVISASVSTTRTSRHLGHYS
jgi:CheY-like chemotaxis protein